MIPASIDTAGKRALYQLTNDVRAKLKEAAKAAEFLRARAIADTPAEKLSGEVIANATLAFRHIEDASMRLGKVLQALDGGVSVYDKDTTPETPRDAEMQPSRRDDFEAAPRAD